MRLAVIAVGRLKAGPEKTLADEYQARAEGLGRKAGISKLTVTEFAESQQASAASRMAEESRLIAGAMPPKAFSIVLDERGKALTSPALADVMRRQLEQATPDMAFVIGGPDGHTQDTRDRASLLLSFGALTWPHRLARVMLFEQIYRVVTIMVNHPYHRP